MIKVKFSVDRDSKSLVFEAEGHANQAEKGKDIICSSASILAYTLAQTATFLYTQKYLRKKPLIKLEDGNTKIVCKPKKDNYNEVLNSYFVIEVGYSLLAKNYPQYVELEMFVESALPTD